MKGSNRCGETTLTRNWQARRKPARINRWRRVSLDRSNPHPRSVMNKGAARPPRPDTRYANGDVWVLEYGFQVAAAWTITINKTARPRNESMWTIRSLSFGIQINGSASRILQRFGTSAIPRLPMNQGRLPCRLAPFLWYGRGEANVHSWPLGAALSQTPGL